MSVQQTQFVCAVCTHEFVSSPSKCPTCGYRSIIKKGDRGFGIMTFVEWSIIFGVAYLIYAAF